MALRSLVFVLTLVAGLLWSLPHAVAVDPIGCTPPADDTTSLICADPALLSLDQILVEQASGFEEAYAGRRQLLRQFDQRFREWREKQRRECGVDAGCISSTYRDFINRRIRSPRELPLLVWSPNAGGQAALVEQPQLGFIPSLPADNVDADRARLLGYWSGSFHCNGRDGTMELVFEPGFGGTVVGFLGAFTADRGPADPMSRTDFNVQRAGGPGQYVLSARDSRINVRTPGMMFAHVTMALSADDTTITGTFDAPTCEGFSVARADTSATLDATIQLVRDFGKDVWSWPYDPAAVPVPAIAAYCRTWLDWTRRFDAHFPEGELGRYIFADVAALGVNMLDDPDLVGLIGGPYETLSEADRTIAIRAYRDACASNPLIRRAFAIGSDGLFRLVSAQEVTQEYRDIVTHLGAIRNSRAWRQTAEIELADASDKPGGYGLAGTYETEALDRLAILLPGERDSFAALIADTRRRSGLILAETRIAEALANDEGETKLTALTRVLAELEPVFVHLDPGEPERLVASVHTAEDSILGALMAERSAEIDGFGSGLAAVESGRKWFGQFLARYGFYRDRDTVDAVIAAFAARRAGDVAAVADEMAAIISAAATEQDLTNVAERYVVAEFDQADPVVGAAFAERENRFAWDKLVAGYSPFEKSLAGSDGRLTVPASYPEPTEDEIKLAVAREYGQYGGVNSDGSFNYGLIPEGSVSMRVVGVTKAGCTPGGGGYVCAREVQMLMEMSSAMRGVLNNSIQGDLMQSMLDMANSVETDVMNDTFILTEGGWRSPTIAAKAASGIARSMETVVDVVTGVGCGLSELNDLGGC